ncbi:MAG: lamin tail domain-containing protein [Candidatus Omnitrophota bacterium]
MILKLQKDKEKFVTGFTLTEVLFVVLLIALLIAVVYPYLRATHTGWKTLDRRQEVIQNARVGMDKMNRLLREATGFTSVTGASDNNGRIVFLDKDSNTVEFKKYNDGTNDMLGYVTGANTYSLAGPIEALTFTCYKEDGVTTTTTASDIKSVEVKMVVADSESEVPSQTFISRIFYRKDTATAIVINEILYYPCNDTGSDKEREFEFIEVYNNGAENIDLNGWQIQDSGGTDTDIIEAYGASSTILTAGEYAVIGAKDTKIFTKLNITCDIKLKTNDNEFGDNKLGNSNDTVVLKNSGGVQIDSVSYSSSWGGGYSQTGNTGTSYSLERIDPSGTSNDSGNWDQNESASPNAVVVLGSGSNKVTVSFYCTPGELNSVSD